MLPDEFTLPADGWIALHQDGSVCLHWTTLGMRGGKIIPFVRFTAEQPKAVVECDASGESLTWFRITVTRQDMAALMGGTSRFMDE